MLSDRFADALAFAAELHLHQVRKGTDIPYVSHLLAVTSLALEHGADEDTAIAAVLHDAIEDQGSDDLAPKIALRFGTRVLAMVEACSDASAAAGGAKPPWRARKQAYIDKLASAPAEACLIIACDKVHNLRCLIGDLERDGLETLDRFNAPGELGWYYGAVADALAARGERGPVAELQSLSAVFADRSRRG